MTIEEIRNLLALAEKAAPGPWRWRDAYETREHAEHQKQGLDADCENIREGRIKLHSASGEIVLDEWGGYEDGGIAVTLADARFIEIAREAAPKLGGEVLQRRKDWLAMLHAVAAVAPDETRWDEADDDTLLEEFDPWEELRRVRAGIIRLRTAAKHYLEACTSGKAPLPYLEALEMKLRETLEGKG